MSGLGIVGVVLGSLVALVVIAFVAVAVLATRAAKALSDPSMDPGAKDVDADDRAFVERLCAEALREGSGGAMTAAEREAAYGRAADCVARAAGDRDRMEEAARGFGALLAAGAEDARAWAGLAETVLLACYSHDEVYWRGGLAKGEPFVERALALAPDDADARALGAAFRARRGYIDDAAKRLEGVEGWRACSVRALVLRVQARAHATADERRRGRAAAADELRRAADCAPSVRKPGLLARLGSDLGELDRRDDALRAFDEALALAPDRAWTWHNRALLLYRAQRYDEALASSDRSLALADFGAARALNARLRARASKK